MLNEYRSLYRSFGGTEAQFDSDTDSEDDVSGTDAVEKKYIVWFFCFLIDIHTLVACDRKKHKKKHSKKDEEKDEEKDDNDDDNEEGEEVEDSNEEDTAAPNVSSDGKRKKTKKRVAK
jgi:hypothetical protein